MIKRNKVVKFALKMRDDYECRDLETLREYFDLEKAIAYFQDGRLITWMKHRGFYDIADELEEMSAEAAEFPQKLCSLLEVEYTGEAVDAEDIAFYNERLKEIKQYTNDEKILSNAGCVAINQEELGELLEDDVKVIYLLDGEYSIPIKRKNHKYIGIGNVTAKIRSKEPVDFKGLGIEFENICFNDEYLTLPSKISANKCFKLSSKVSVEEYLQRLYCEAANIPLYSAIERATMGDVAMMIIVGYRYEIGSGIAKNTNVAFDWYKKAAECYKRGDGVPVDMDKAIKLYNKVQW